jgi:hypothetical protein
MRLLVTSAIVLLASTLGAQTGLPVGGRKQLFIDHKFIESSDGIALVSGAPYQTREELVVADQSWEKDLIIGSYSTVLKEDGKVRLWYNVLGGVWKPHENPSFMGVAYAESSDGIHFRKPVLKLVERDGDRENNFVLPADPSLVTIGGGTVMRDDNPKCPPAERYKSWSKFYPRKGTGLKGPHRVWYSADGLRWKLYDTLATGLRAADTQPSWFWDPRVNRYVGYSREWVRRADGYGLRMASYNESDDMLHWDSTMLVLEPDERDFTAAPRASIELDKARVQGENVLPPEVGGDQVLAPAAPVDMYGPGVFRYAEADGVYIALTPMFHHWRAEGKSSWPSTGDVQLGVSRDARHFQRAPGRRAFLGVGSPGSFDSKWVWALPNPVRMGDELWIYYLGTNQDHSGGVDPAAKRHLTAISRAILRLDGFMSAEAAYEGGWIITPPLTFEGSRLELNLDTGAGGVARVEILDAAGKPIPGYGLAQADELNGNNVRMPVTWKGSANLAPLAGKSVRLHIRMRAARLYAFQFKP